MSLDMNQFAKKTNGGLQLTNATVCIYTYQHRYSYLFSWSTYAICIVYVIMQLILLTEICDELTPINVDLKCYHKNIQINCSSTSLLAGDRVQPTCKSLYTFSDFVPSYKEIICQENGKWNKDLFSCSPGNFGLSKRHLICNQYTFLF